MADKESRFYWLDWIRFASAFAVVVCHSRSQNWVEWGLLDPTDRTPPVRLFYTLTRPAIEVVLIFFVLSGFLVGGKVFERCLDRTFNPTAFVIDRVSRIWLPLIPALLLTAGIAWYCGFPDTLLAFFGNLFALQGIACENFGKNGPLWSLSYEVWFYVLAWLGGMLIMGGRRGLVLLMGLTVCFFVFTKLSPMFLHCWLLGAFAYFISARKNFFNLIVPGVFLALAGIALSQAQSNSRSINIYGLQDFLPSRNAGNLIESLGVGLLLAGACRANPTSPLAIRFERAGVSLAAFSYTLYLTHYPLLHLWTYLLPNQSSTFDVSSLAAFGVKIASCLLMAWLLYLPFEGQTPRVRKWLKSRFYRPRQDSKSQIAEPG